MKTLFPRQRDSVDYFKAALLKHGAALDSSSTGVGKTVVASRIALELNRPVAVICPKIVLSSWKRELAEVGVEPLFVLNYEKIRTGNTPFLKRVGKKLYRWMLPPDTLIIWDECHKLAGNTTLNAQMLVASVQAKYLNLMLSATACQDPTEMRAIGYALGLHSLNKPENGKNSWHTWMIRLGCVKDQWHNWKMRNIPRHLEELNRLMYSTNCFKLTPKDLPHAFSDNHIITEPLSFASSTVIRRFYEDNDVTPEIVEQFLDGKMESSEHVMVQILRARQLAEAAKVPDIIDMIWDARSEGFSVAVFVNFSDTLKAIAAAFPTGCSTVCGGQSDTERENYVQAFQTNRNRVIVCNAAAGGVGVSLHDTDGNYPRMSLISPTFDPKIYTQVLGRIHRAGAKSPSTQRILVTEGTVEEKVLEILERKRKAMETLHAQQTP